MSAPIFPSTWQIPIDFMIRKGHLGIIKDNLKVYDAYGNKLYRVTGRSSPSSSSSSHRIKTLFDVHGSPMISVVRRDDGWQCFRGNNWDREDSVFTAKIVYDYKFRSELEVFLSGKEIGDQIPNFTLKGNRFWRSCTIYSRDSIVAQHSAYMKPSKKVLFFIGYKYLVRADEWNVNKWDWEGSLKVVSKGQECNEWNVNKWDWEGSLKVVSKGQECIIRLEDKTTGVTMF
ncbi:uncharacterized protein A4U43_C07F4190 [Asparagus officinalis]|uniref:Uncharacterized protein n=1 Tax=Asparagus officinalis TaxID=4686 RepID=A0A5P1E9D0_ASPOF|nr:uncharacterized protein A4U43_C07F4190 [Asparagus officinalis]